MTTPFTGRGLFCTVLTVFLIVLAGFPSWRLTERIAKAAEPRDPAADRMLTVTVLDSQGNPIEGARVRAQFADRKNAESYSNNEGLVIINQKNDWQTLTVTAEGKTPSRMDRQDNLKEKAPASVVFKMDEATTIGGVVVDDKDKPVADAEITLIVRKKYPGSMQRAYIYYQTTMTDGNGKWSYQGPPADFDEAEIGAWSPTHLPKDETFPLGVYKDKEALKDGSAKLTLPAGTPVRVKITDADGNPIPGATLGYGRTRRYGNSIPNLIADEQGLINIGIEPGATTPLTAFARKHAPRQRWISTGTTPLDIVLTLENAKPLTGKVVDPDGKPLKGTRIVFSSWRGTDVLGGMLSDDSGEFLFNDAPVDALHVTALLQGYMQLENVRVKVGEANLIKMQWPTRFSGKVVDAQTGAAIKKFSIAVGVDEKDDEGIRWGIGERVGDTDEKKGSDGSFTRVFDTFYPARVMRVSADGYLPSDSDTFEMDGKIHEFTFKLSKGKPLAGVVKDASGKPVDKARVLLMTPTVGIAVFDGRLRERDIEWVPSTLTRPDGGFEFPPQKDIYGLVVITDEGYGQATREDFEKTKTLTLERWAKIEGEIRDGTKPDAGARIVTTNTYLSQDLPTDPLRGMTLVSTAAADKNGRFVFDRVPPVKITAAKMYETDRSCEYYETQTIDPRPGETVKVKIGGVGRPVAGKVEIPDSVVKQGYINGLCDLALKNYPRPPRIPTEIRDDEESMQEWGRQWRKSDEGKIYRESLSRIMAAGKEKIPVNVQMDGSFRIENVTPGEYELSFELVDRPTGYDSDVLAARRIPLTVQEIPGGVSDEPLEIGNVKLEVLSH